MSEHIIGDMTIEAAVNESVRVDPRLPEGYYVDNFEIVLATVRERYEDVLSGAELSFLGGWSTLSLAARRLYVRLVSRKGPCLRRDRVAYSEIPDLDAALAELAHAGFADDAPGAAAVELLPLLRCDELRALARDLGAATAPAARKPELLAALAGEVDAATLDRELRRRVDVVRPRRQDAVLAFRLLFFGNLRQDWTEFVLRDLGVVRYEPYELRAELRLFPTRAAVDDVLTLQACRDEVRGLLAAGELDAALGAGRAVLARRAAWHPSARRHRDRVCLKLGRALERLAHGETGDEAARLYGEALAFYEAAEAPPARERRARILARLGRCDDALALCAEIAAAARDETEARFAPRFAERVRRPRGEAVAPRRRRRPVAELALARRDGRAVEELALAAVAAAGGHGFFAENWLWKSLFGLAFWDVIYAPVEGAFQHPFQLGPLDLHTPDFRKARAVLVERRLAELRAQARPGPRLLAVYEAKHGTANPLVAWHEELRPRLALALERLTGEHLARVCDRLSRDVGRYRRGFPDLFVARDAAPGFELLEVKAPGDQLRPEQAAWIDYLNAHGLPASILRLSWV